MAKRSEQIIIRLTVEEKDYIERAAAEMDITMSDYVRWRLIDYSKEFILYKQGILEPGQLAQIDANRTSRLVKVLEDA